MQITLGVPHLILLFTLLVLASNGFLVYAWARQRAITRNLITSLNRLIMAMPGQSESNPLKVKPRKPTAVEGARLPQVSGKE
jgi:hypothetical protein